MYVVLKYMYIIYGLKDSCQKCQFRTIKIFLQEELFNYC